ncbi:hypothetical protein RUM43_010903 [Polyplax serrata]|uniref:Cuticle protein 6 n=1 Tax=Polyplax serrata TaxID=468196 RepID=A0AAN8S7L1_POLSC
MHHIIVACSEATQKNKRQVYDNDAILEDNYKELFLDIKEENKTQFLEQDTKKGEYEFGYQISSDGTFHHENRAPDGVTYGCYGYIDAYGTPIEYYYVSDGWGYRIVTPNTPVEIFYHVHEQASHEHNEENQSNGNTNSHQHNEHHQHHGDIVEWNDLKFPKHCLDRNTHQNKPGSAYPAR